MSLWVDKYRPRSFSDLSYHEDLSAHLQQLCSTPDFPHLLLYGPSGAGKKTRITAILNEIYGPGAEKIKIDTKEIISPSNKKIEINIISSNYHIEITPSDVGSYDRIIVQDLIKEIAQMGQVNPTKNAPFKIVILNEADNLSRDAQAALRRTMEKYMKTLRVILCCESISKIILPIQSRCLLLRVPAPTDTQIIDVLSNIAKSESFSVPQEYLSVVAESSKGNLRRAILMFEAAKVQNTQLSKDSKPILADWNIVITDLANNMLADQSPKKLLECRRIFYLLLSHCIPPDIIIKELAFSLVQRVPNDIKPDVISKAAEFENRMKNGSKHIFHLEAFAANFMAVYKGYQFSSIANRA